MLADTAPPCPVLVDTAPPCPVLVDTAPPCPVLADTDPPCPVLADTDPPCPVLVDNMRDEANRHYGVVSERLYILLDARVVYKGGFGPAAYSLQEVADWLGAFQQTLQGRLH